MKVLAFLEREGVGAALVGGLAVSARAEPRFTRDVDIAVQVVDDDDAGSLILPMRGHGYVAVDLVEQEAIGRLAKAKCLKSGDEQGIVVDLLFASSGIEPDIVRDAEPLEIASGIVVPVAASARLIATKFLARSPRRPQDDADIFGLWDTADQAVLEKLLRLIESGGFDRGKSLSDELAKIQELLSSSNTG